MAGQFSSVKQRHVCSQGWVVQLSEAETYLQSQTHICVNGTIRFCRVFLKVQQNSGLSDLNMKSILICIYGPYKSQTAIAKVNIILRAISFYKERKYGCADCNTYNGDLMSNII
jgi:hypothetical protein